MLARQIRRLRPGLVLLQHPDDLIFREPCSLHLSVLQEGRTLNPRGGKSQRQVKPNTILWDLEVRGFVARRQFSDIVTFSVVYRTRENVQRWQKLERFPILTPHLARQEAIRV